MSQVATRGQWGARIGRSQWQCKLLWVPVGRDLTFPARQGPPSGGRDGPRPLAQTHCPAWLGPAHCLFALETTQGCILAFERGESGKHCTTL